MLEYELSQLVPYGAPVLGGIICMLIGMAVTNKAWKTRIHRYAKADIIQIMEFQKNKIEQQAQQIKEKNALISDYKGKSERSRVAALKIIGENK